MTKFSKFFKSVNGHEKHGGHFVCASKHTFKLLASQRIYNRPQFIKENKRDQMKFSMSVLAYQSLVRSFFLFLFSTWMVRDS